MSIHSPHVIYRIRDWADHFENNRTRELKRLDWVPVPNKHDGDGFTELMEHPNGAAHYGAWMLIVQVASKCDQRGTLLRDGSKPYSAKSLARVTRGSEAVFIEAIPRLISIGWLEALPVEGVALPENVASQCDNSASQCVSRARAGMEGKGMEGNGTQAGEGARAGEAERPGVPEVLAFAATIGLAEWKARDWFEEMESVGWLDFHSRPVVKWQPMLTRVCRKWEADGRPEKPPPARNGHTHCEKPLSVLDLKTVIEFKRKRASQIRNQHYTEGPVGGSWNNANAFDEYKGVRSEIKRLEKELESRA